MAVPSTALGDLLPQLRHAPLRPLQKRRSHAAALQRYTDSHCENVSPVALRNVLVQQRPAAPQHRTASRRLKGSRRRARRLEKKNSTTTWKKKGRQPMRAPVRRKWEKKVLPHARRGAGQQLPAQSGSAAAGC